MSSSRPTRRAVLLAPLALAACGFTPAYGPGGSAGGLRGRVRAQDPVDKDSFALVAALEERIGRPQAVTHELRYVLNTKVEGAGITPTNAITRFNLIGAVDWVLVDSGTGKEQARGRASGFTSWSATGNTVAARAAEDDARIRMMRILADQMMTQLIAVTPDLAAK